MPESQGTVCFAHGKDSSPESTKISYLSPKVVKWGWQWCAPDLSALSPEQQPEVLIQTLRGMPKPWVIAGSSLGGLVAVATSRLIDVEGLFLMAPALYLKDYPDVDYAHECTGPVHIVHGLQDDICLVEGSVQFARRHGAQLLAIPGDHSLHDQLPLLARALKQLLRLVA